MLTLQGEFWRQCFFSESPMSGEYFGRLIIALVCYIAVSPQTKNNFPK